MTELTNEQVVKLAEVIRGWILSDPDLCWDIAVEQAKPWTLKEYYGMFPEENRHEEPV